jgi:CelD/BcsL family acetyltransferase involved in cellulose biosynthesis
MKLELVRADELGEGELERWRRLARRDCSLDNPYLGADFARVVSTLRPEARVALLIDGGTPVGFLALAKSFGVYGPIAAGFANREGIVHCADLDWDAARAALASLPGWRYEHLIGEQARRLGSRGPMSMAPTMSLSAGWDAYLAWARSAHPRSIKTAARSLRRLRDVHDEIEFRYHDVESGALNWLVRTKNEQCERNGWRGVLAERWLLELAERLLAEQSGPFAGVLSTLRADDEIIAASLGVRSSSVHASSLIAYAPNFAHWRPGWICSLQLSEEIARRGLLVHDLGVGSEDFKQVLANDCCEEGAGALASRSPLGVTVAAGDRLRRTIAQACSTHPVVERRARQAMRSLRRWRYRSARRLPIRPMSGSRPGPPQG